MYRLGYFLQNMSMYEIVGSLGWMMRQQDADINF
jgi:hypothetical protein